MKLKRSVFGYSKKSVDEQLEDYENLIELQRRDIEFLKRDNHLLKSTISSLTEKNDNEK